MSKMKKRQSKLHEESIEKEEEINAKNDGEEKDENMFHLSKEDIHPAETVCKE